MDGSASHGPAACARVLRVLLDGAADVLHFTGDAAIAKPGYYLYFNNWGTCPGVNCCDSPAGCATCCFDKPPHPYLPGCGDLTNGSDPYGSYHTVQAYYTADFTTFTNLGMALELAVRKPGTEFRPHVVCNPKTKKFLMWFEDRGSGLTGCKRCTLHFDLPFPHPGHLHLPLPPPLYITPPSLGPTANCHQQTPPRSRLRH